LNARPAVLLCFHDRMTASTRWQFGVRKMWGMWTRAPCSSKPALCAHLAGQQHAGRDPLLLLLLMLQRLLLLLLLLLLPLLLVWLLLLLLPLLLVWLRL
jgi:hypothetical protein